MNERINRENNMQKVIRVKYYKLFPLKLLQILI